MVYRYTSWWRGSSKHHWLWELSLKLKQLGFWASPLLLPDSRTSNLQWNANCTGSFAVWFCLSQVRNAKAVGPVLDMSSHGGFWSTDSSSTIFFNRLCFKSPLKVSAIPSLQPFSTTLCPFHSASHDGSWIQHPENSQLLQRWPFVPFPPCAGLKWLSSGQLSSQQSSSYCVNQAETLTAVLKWLAHYFLTLWVTNIEHF